MRWLSVLAVVRAHEGKEAFDRHRCGGCCDGALWDALDRCPQQKLPLLPCRVVRCRGPCHVPLFDVDRAVAAGCRASGEQASGVKPPTASRAPAHGVNFGGIEELDLGSTDEVTNAGARLETRRVQ